MRMISCCKAWHNRNTPAVKTVWFAVPFRGKSALSLSFRADRLPIYGRRSMPFGCGSGSRSQFFMIR